MGTLFNLLMPFFNKRYRAGKGIRWIIQDEKGKTPYCFCCGNFANGVGLVKLNHFVLHLPICKSHMASYLDKHHPDGWELFAPCAITINPKFSLKNKP